MYTGVGQATEKEAKREREKKDGDNKCLKVARVQYKAVQLREMPLNIAIHGD